jgi:hypothetical protein
VPETPEQLHARASGALRMPPVYDWETFPFDGELRPRPLLPPVEREKARKGEGGVDCEECARSDDEFIWTSVRDRAELRPHALELLCQNVSLLHRHILSSGSVIRETKHDGSM